MAQLTAVSFKPYRRYQLELHDSGKAGCSVIIHPPSGGGAPHQVQPDGEVATLGQLIARAKLMIDAVLGPRPPVKTGYRPRYPADQSW